MRCVSAASTSRTRTPRSCKDSHGRCQGGVVGRDHHLVTLPEVQPVGDQVQGSWRISRFRAAVGGGRMRVWGPLPGGPDRRGEFVMLAKGRAGAVVADRPAAGPCERCLAAGKRSRAARRLNPRAGDLSGRIITCTAALYRTAPSSAPLAETVWPTWCGTLPIPCEEGQKR